jgi:hypothetical protein
MNGAENLLQTLVEAGLEVCFANPGTSEMHLVSAIGNSDPCGRCCACSRGSLPAPPTATPAWPTSRR